MRTTIRLADEKRNSLLNLAQQRGERGVSRVVEDAVAFYLSEHNKPVLALEPQLAPGQWQSIGARIDERVAHHGSLLGLVTGLLRGALNRLPLVRV